MLCVTLTWPHRVVVRVSVLETGFSLMELDYEARGAQIVSIHHTTVTGPTGIYHCDIATSAVHDDTDISVRDTVYGDCILVY